MSLSGLANRRPPAPASTCTRCGLSTANPTYLQEGIVCIDCFYGMAISRFSEWVEHERSNAIDKIDLALRAVGAADDKQESVELVDPVRQVVIGRKLE